MPRAKTSAKKPKSKSKENNSSTPTATIVEFEPCATPHSDLEEKIRQRAYELFLERGGQHGYAEEDWARAEAEILGHSERRTA
jgi:Protein of unknown function (DUF2934)